MPHTFNISTRNGGRQASVNFRPAWSSLQVLDKSELHSEILSRKRRVGVWTQLSVVVDSWETEGWYIQDHLGLHRETHSQKTTNKPDSIGARL